MANRDLKEIRKQMLALMEQKLHEMWSSEKDSQFYYHFSEYHFGHHHLLQGKRH